MLVRVRTGTRVEYRLWQLELSCGHRVSRTYRPKKRVHCEICAKDEESR